MDAATRLSRSSIFPNVPVASEGVPPLRSPADAGFACPGVRDTSCMLLLPRGGACLGRFPRGAGDGLHDLRRQPEADVLGHDLNLTHVGKARLTQIFDDLIHQALGSRR